MNVYVVNNMSRDDCEIMSATLGVYIDFEKAKQVYEKELKTVQEESSIFKKAKEYGYEIEDRSGIDKVVLGIAFGEPEFYYELVIEKFEVEV